MGSGGEGCVCLGADFRRMRDAAALVGEVKRVLGEWGERSGRGRAGCVGE